MALRLPKWPISFSNNGIRTPLFHSLLIRCLVISVSAWGFNCFAQTETPPEQPPAVESTPAQPAPNSPPPSRNMRSKELLADALEDESHWLDTSEGRILALYRRTEAKVTKGALLLLHAAEDPQVWPPALENLRKRLPQYGWETLAITLPQKYPQTPPVRSEDTIDTAEQPPEETTAGTAHVENNATAVSIPAREQLIKAYLLAALGFLNEKGQFNLVVLVDNSSFYWCMQLLSPNIKTNQADPDTVDGPLQALVITNLQPQEPLSIHELEDSLNQPQLPVLDIFFAPDDIEQKAQREIHKTVAMRNKLDFYQQFSIEQQPKIIEADTASFLLGRVRGFMEKKAKGSEVKGSEVKVKEGNKS